MSTEPETFQIPLEAAEAYEASFVPAFFAEWAPHLLDVAGVAGGQQILDVACGTGIVARTAADRIDAAGIVGVDLNEAMLTVARRLRPGLEWHQGDVAQLRFPDDRFDVVLCQMALMFFPDRTRALSEMARVTRPGGVVAISVPASLDEQPLWKPFMDMLAEHAGPEARPLLSTYWSCGDAAWLRGLFEAAGLGGARVTTRTCTARYASADAAVATEVESTPLIDRISAAAYERIKREARTLLRPYESDDGEVRMPIVGHLVSGRKT